MATQLQGKDWRSNYFEDENDHKRWLHLHKEDRQRWLEFNWNDYFYEDGGTYEDWGSGGKYYHREGTEHGFKEGLTHEALCYDCGKSYEWGMRPKLCSCKEQ